MVHLLDFLKNEIIYGVLRMVPRNTDITIAKI